MPSDFEFLLYEIRTDFINVSEAIADCPSSFLPIPLGAPLCTTSDSLRAASNSLRAASAADAAASLSAASLFAFSKSEARASALRNSSLRALLSFSNPICTRRSSLAVCSAFLCVVRAAVTSVLARLRSAFTLAHANCTPLLEEKDLKNDRLKNYFFWTFATHMTQIPPQKYNFTQFAAFFHFLFFKINYYFV